MTFQAAPENARRVKAAAVEFEALVIAQLLEPLFSSVSAPEIAGGGRDEAYFNSLLQEQYARAMAERGGLGLAAHVQSTLLELQSARAIALGEFAR
jgi:Rod binding domain-containing protein